MPAADDFVHIHLSGLWDAPRARWAAAVADAMEHANVITGTEFTQSPLTRGWFQSHGWELIYFEGAGRDEGWIAYKTKVFEHVGNPWCLPISTTPFALGKGTIRPRTHLTGSRLRHVNGEEIVLEVFHTPSAVEGAGRLVDAKRSKALLECFAAVARHRKAELKGENYILAADWNLDLKKVWVRTLLRLRLPGLRSGWRKLPKGGSHGKRLIDGVRFAGKLVVTNGGSRLRAIVAGFDHRQVVTSFRFAR